MHTKIKKCLSLFLLVLILLLATSSIFVADKNSKADTGETFVSTTVEGAKITYLILSDNTVQIGDGSWRGAIKTNTGQNWSGNITIPEVVIPDGASSTVGYTVVSVSYQAFYNSKILSFNMEGSPNINIDTSAFQKCNSLTTFTMNGSISSIGASAFQDCDSLTTFTMNGSISSIGASAFQKCDSLTTFTMNGSISSIGASAFQDCNALSTFYVNGSVGIISESAFKINNPNNNVSLEFTVTGDLTTIGDRAFQNCDSLTSFTVNGTGEMTIGSQAFQYSDALSTFQVNSSISSIGASAFQSCNALGTFYVNGSVGTIYESAFNIVSPGNDVTLEFTVTGNVTTIGDRAFQNCDSLTSFTVNGTGEMTIGSQAFQYSDALSTFQVNSSISSIGASAFQDCNALSTFYVNGSVGTICQSAFNIDSPGNDVTLEFTVAGDVTTIDAGAFKNCDSLTSFTVNGTGEMTIGSQAFQYSDALSTFQVNSSISSIGASAFQSCNALSTFYVNGSVDTIYESAFNIESPGNDVTLEFTVNGSVKTINARAFQNCYSLTSFITNESPENGKITIGEAAFNSCKNLEEFSVVCLDLWIGSAAFRNAGSNVSSSINFIVIKIPSNYTNPSASYTAENPSAVTVGIAPQPDRLSFIITLPGSNVWDGWYGWVEIIIQADIVSTFTVNIINVFDIINIGDKFNIELNGCIITDSQFQMSSVDYITITYDDAFDYATLGFNEISDNTYTIDTNMNNFQIFLFEKLKFNNPTNTELNEYLISCGDEVFLTVDHSDMNMSFNDYGSGVNVSFNQGVIRIYDIDETMTGCIYLEVLLSDDTSIISYHITIYILPESYFIILDS